jgi:ATP-binding cassette subfamily B protein
MFGAGGPRAIMEREVLKPKNTGETLRRFAKYFRRYWPALLAAALFVSAATWAQVIAPDLIGQAVDCYLTPTAPAGSAGFPGAPAAQSNCWYEPESTANLTADQRVAGLGGLALRIVGLFVLSSMLTGLTFFTMSWAGQRALKAIRVDVFAHLHRLSVGYYAENEAGNLMSRITSDSETIQQALSFALVNVASGVLLIGSIMVNMLSKSLAFAAISLLAVPLMFASTLWFSAQARKAFRRTRAEMGNVNAELQESISGVREVQAFSRERENIEAFRDANAANRDANIRAVAFTSALAPTLEALGYVAIATVVGVGGLLLLRGETLLGASVSLGLVITFLAYVQRINQPIQQIAVLWANVQSAIAGGERIFGLLDVTPDVQDRPDARPLTAIRGEVEFAQVKAEYEKDVPVLRGVSFKAKPGETIAIVGPTGAGKTTIINLLPRFYDVTGGSVRIDGVDVRQVTAASLRQQIGIVLQDNFLFSDTIMNNIRFGKLGATDEEVIAAAQLAHADSFVERLPDGYQTVLGERGRGLSQGQRQLIAIARAALSDPRILILDEATSSIDTQTERVIQEALRRLLQGRTSIVIAHRLSTIREADLIVVMDAGRIVEQGTHEALMARRGRYFELATARWRAEAA